MLAHAKCDAHRKRARIDRGRVVPRRAARPARRPHGGGRRSGRVRVSFFSPRTPQHVRTPLQLEPWLGGVAMLGGLLSWGVVLGLLGG